MVRIIPSRLKPSSTTTSRSSSPMRSKGEGSPGTESGLILKVLVIRARGLAAKDRGGTSDPYLVLTLGDAKYSTHSVDKTLNPEWNVRCQLPIVGSQSLLLDVIAWDKDKFGKDYLGEFDLALEEIFANGSNPQEPQWYPLKSKRPGRKTSVVSGEVQLQFTLLDTTNQDATDQQILEKLLAVAGSDGATPIATPAVTPALGVSHTLVEEPLTGGEEEDEVDEDESPGGEDEPTSLDTSEKRKKRHKLKGLKRRRRQRAYEFNNTGSDVVGVIFLEICKITDLPPEHNVTRTGFDMDPFVVATLGKKTYRTRRIKHSLNPVYNEKMIFQVLGHEQKYSFGFTVIDHDKYSGNDFIASANLPLKELIERAPHANPDTGLHEVEEPAEYVPATRPKLLRLGLSRSSSSQSLSRMGNRPALGRNTSSTVNAPQPPPPEMPGETPSPVAAPAENPVVAAGATAGEATEDDPSFNLYSIPLKMKNVEKWEDKHNPVLYVRAKYQPYPALRQQFWRAMLKQFDNDESGCISKVELTTMLDTLGSTLRESTIDSFFERFPHKASNGDEFGDLTMDEAVICLEDQLEKSRSQSLGDRMKSMLPNTEKVKAKLKPAESSSPSETSSQVATISVPELKTPGEEGDALARSDDLAEDRNIEEHVVEIKNCPICHQPRLNKRKDTDIITHIATCASQDWRQVNELMMAGFVTASQAQRKWYSKVLTKISYGGYKLGANSANILVQDRSTGQINEEKMSVYVRLGIRLLYKGLKSNKMENKRIRKLLQSLSVKQGKKYDDPASKDEIPKFVDFHQLNMSEVLRPLEEFKNFNEFFYRALKPGARPCSAPNNANIVVSPADCRSVVFNSIDKSTSIWIKGRDFSVKRLLGDAYPEDASRFEGGPLGIFRLAPQDYHRFHFPVDGKMGKPIPIAGEYYTVNPMAIRSALDVYSENVRVLVPVDSPTHGRVMIVCVGAMMVGSTVITQQEGAEVRRADELGYFKFGGSTIVLLFEKGKMVFDDDLVGNSEMALETLVRVGMSVGHSPNVPQWTPDMRKNEQEITEEAKAEAKLRIQGSLSTDDSPNDSSGDEPGAGAITPTAI
ncbi:phosphatidylserine decarboxylase [Zalerion maritima]|uniref:Phosphatidylserine decarboxylase proenzyme 2 n=1 Tax=Zalerion maritima TaxID=339359 RepID=A0AAD5RPA6_9PEZI|nr:phosphatidylserine decarboxylase [Zalerion maritima]